MDSEETGTVTPDEVFDNWAGMDINEKINLLTNLPTETIAALTELLKEFDKSGSRVAEARKERNDALIELLKKGNRPFEETLKLIELLDKGINDFSEDTEKSDNRKIKMLIVVGGIVSIVAGSAMCAKDKKAGSALIAAGSTALIGAAGSETKMGKAIFKALSNIQNEEVVEVSQ